MATVQARKSQGPQLAPWVVMVGTPGGHGGASSVRFPAYSSLPGSWEPGPSIASAVAGEWAVWGRLGGPLTKRKGHQEPNGVNGGRRAVGQLGLQADWLQTDLLAQRASPQPPRRTRKKTFGDWGRSWPGTQKCSINLHKHAVLRNQQSWGPALRLVLRVTAPACKHLLAAQWLCSVFHVGQLTESS